MVLSAHNIFGDSTLFSNSEGERALQVKKAVFTNLTLHLIVVSTGKALNTQIATSIPKKFIFALCSEGAQPALTILRGNYLRRLIVDLHSEKENAFAEILITSVSEGARFAPTTIF